MKARKAAAREDRRIARRQRQKDPGSVSTLEGADTAFSEAPDETEPTVAEVDSTGASPTPGDLAGPGQESI